MLEGGMTSTPAKTAARAPGKPAPDAPKKRRPSPKLVLLVLAPLLLAGGAYAGWTMIAPAGAGTGEAAASTDARAGEAEGGGASPDLAAETSFTHSFALSVLIAPRCGAARVPALSWASGEEALADGRLVNLSWLAAARRAAATTEKSCDHLRAEVVEAERSAMQEALERRVDLNHLDGGPGQRVSAR